MLRFAVAMIGQRLNDPAVAEPAMAALLDHPCKLALEAQQAGDTPVDLRQVAAGFAVGLAAGDLKLRRHRQQRPDVLQLKSELAGMPRDDGRPGKSAVPSASMRPTAFVVIRGTRRQWLENT